jgi:uncharacterized glyoxalase superfamily protein PhnB
MVSGVERAGGGRVIPTLRYRNAGAAIEWLCKAFGFEKKMVVPAESGWVAHAELVLGNGMIMLGDAETEYGRTVRPPEPPERVNTQGIYVIVDDADAHCDHAKAAGAEIVRELVTQDYGGREYTARDLEGHVWTIGTYDPWTS